MNEHQTHFLSVLPLQKCAHKHERDWCLYAFTISYVFHFASVSVVANVKLIHVMSEHSCEHFDDDYSEKSYFKRGKHRNHV